MEMDEEEDNEEFEDFKGAHDGVLNLSVKSVRGNAPSMLSMVQELRLTGSSMKPSFSPAYHLSSAMETTSDGVKSPWDAGSSSDFDSPHNHHLTHHQNDGPEAHDGE